MSESSYPLSHTQPRTTGAGSSAGQGLTGGCRAGRPLLQMNTPYQASLHNQIDRFLPMVRVGVDFGEHAGGIAVVRNHEILYAETYIDFHKATLEERRRLRRGRRTRHAKKMRLSRLRSWVLRQVLPNGERLPDPYLVLKERQFQVQPGIFKAKGQDPHKSTSWLEHAK